MNPGKPVARARCTVHVDPQTAEKIAGQGLAKGDVLGVARIAAIQGAKRTSDLLPNILEAPIGSIEIDFEVLPDSVLVEAVVRSRDGQGVEMEALTACTVAALTIYDMCKAIDRGMTISGIRLIE